MFHGVFSLSGFAPELLVFHGESYDGFSLELLMFHGVFFNGFT
jgi:hypothetical protein